MIAALQVLAGLAWLIVGCLFTPSVWRVWVEHRVDPIDVMVSPIAFIGFIQAGFSIRWLLFPHAIKVMSMNETLVWSGLYVLSFIAAGGSVVAWRIARGIR